MKKILYFLVFIVLVACGKKDGSSGESFSSYSLVKVDSFQVNNMTRVQITDFSKSENIYLAYTEAENDILEISPDGEILKRVNRTGDGPNNMGNWVPLGLSFGPSGERVFQLPFQLLTYDKDYSQTSNIRIQSPLPVRAYIPLGKTHYFTENDQPRYLVGPTTFLSAHLLIHNEEGRDTLQNFSLLYPESGEMKSIVPYESDSYYKKTDNIYYNRMGKSFFVEGDELVVVQNLADEILVYDLKNNFQLKKKIPIVHSAFEQYSPLPIGTPMDDSRMKELNLMAGRNDKIFSLGNQKWLLSYYQGVSPSVYEARNSEDSPFSISKSKDKFKLLVFEDGKQTAGELSPPNGRMLFGLNNNRILVLEEPSEEVEEEFTRYSIYELKKE
ncbi:MAG: hypothetical protein EA341_16320 [Mongoliibacter sp.]|uniref:hypothetical protein n=1 Tax=Mongoliibacter sp. TaxID=2022438 RepID=UPI0012F111AB|nr:hypothetical protein [Mongoliibacter sp.]TVP44707.1 MAG: hypothetical protein EA341_16320 [Mongoliibacter sp.]